MSDALKPCPFCGGNDRLIEYHNPKTVLHPWYRIECEYCGAKGPGSDRGDHVQEWNTRAALSAPQPAAPQDAEIRCAVMGFGCVAIGQTKDQVTGQAGIIYLDMGEQRDIDADTCDLFAPGSVPDPKKVLAHIQFATADSVRQTIDELNALLVEHFGEHAAPAPAQAVPLTEFQIDAVTEAAHQSLRRACSGAQGQQMTMWHGIEAHVVRATERAHGIKQPGSEAC